MIKKFVIFPALALLAGCSVLPSQGPASMSVSGQASQTIDEGKPLNYALVDLNEDTARTLGENVVSRFYGTLKDRRPAPDIRVGIGDKVRVTVFENNTSGAPGLFIPGEKSFSQGNFVNIPDQTVDRTGNIKVPYAGAPVRANGLRPTEIAANIENALKKEATDPEVVVTITERRSNLATVIGDVNEPGRIGLNLGGDRLLDAIGAAGGAKFSPFETQVSMQRGRSVASVMLAAVTDNPKNNIYIRPKDVITVTRKRQTYVMLGAATQNGNYEFQEANMSLAQALSQSGGLIDSRAHASGVFVYRLEPYKTAEALGVDTTGWETKSIPIVYRINMSKASSLFLAQNFPLVDGDLIYISNAPIIPLLKINSIVRDYSSTVVSVENARLAVKH